MKAGLGTNSQSWEWQVDLARISGRRIDLLILDAINKQLGKKIIPTVSRNRLQQLISDGCVTINEQVLSVKSKLKSGDLLKINFPAPEKLEIEPEKIPIDILFEDEHLVVINKPQGLTVHPSPSQKEGTLVHALLYHIKNLSGIGGKLRPGIVHRLDKFTSGALVVAKSDEAHRKLVEIFSAHSIERVYWALCYGALGGSKKAVIKIESRIGRNPKDRKKMAFSVKNGKKAVTFLTQREEYFVKNKPPFVSLPFASLIEAKLETGRTHQVRVHLTAQGASIMGDPLYGVPTRKNAKWVALPTDIQSLILQLPGQALHARVLGFTHPITGESLRLEANPPEIFKQLLAGLREFSR